MIMMMIRLAPYGVMFFLTGLFVVQVYLALEGASYPAAKMLAALSIACLGCLRSAMADREAAAAPRLADRRLLAGTAVMVGVLYVMIAAALLTPLGESLKPWEFLVFPVCAFLFFLRSQASFLLLSGLEGLFIFYTIRTPGTAPMGHVVVLCAFWMGYLLLLALLFLRDRQPDSQAVLAADRKFPLRAGPIAGLLLIDLFGLFLVVKPPGPIRPEPGRTDAPLEPLSIAQWIENSTLAFERDLSFGDQPGGAGEDETVFVAQLRDETGRILDDFSFPPYWRFGALSIYRDGHWVAEEGTPEMREGPVRFPPPPPQVEAPAIEQRIILSPMRTDALFALSRVESIDLPAAAVDAEDGVRRGSSFLPARPFKYVARSRPIVRVPPELGIAAAHAPDPRYLQVPQTVANAGPFREAARRIGPAETAFAHVERAIEFLSWHEYTRTPGLRPDGDPTVEFLRHKRGYCQHFASALALLLRQRGVPTRVAIGFAGGEWDPIARIVRVKRRHAHAWVEVHFDALGWLPFDPATAAADRPAAARLRGGPGETPDEHPRTPPGAPGSEATRPTEGSLPPTEVRPVDEPDPADAESRRALSRLFEELWARVEDEPAAGRALGDRARGVEFVLAGEGRPRSDIDFFASVAAADAALLLGVGGLVALFGAGLRLARRARTARRRQGMLPLVGADPTRPDAGPLAVPEGKDRASRRRRIVRLYEDVLARAGAAGRSREAHVTASEYLEFNSEIDGLRELTALFERARYAPQAPTDHDVAAALEASRRVVRSLKRDK